MEEILPINYYSELAGVIIDTTMVNEFLKKYFPVLGDFFTRNDFSVSTFIHKWLVTLFTENFKEDTTFLIWDFLFLEGNIVLIKTCLIVFCILKRLLLKNENNFEDLFIILTSETSNIKANNPTLLHGLSLKQFEFNEEYLEMTREMLSMSIVKGIDEDNKEKFLKKNKMNNNTKSIIDPNSNSESNQIKCNVKWPICYQEEIIDKPITVKKFLILHHNSPTNYISDYFFDSLSQKKDPIPDNDDSYYDLLIERQKHSCYSSIMEKLKPQLAHHINKIINYSQSKEMEYKLKNNDSLLNENNKEQIYRRMSTKNDYVAARELINKSFKAKPYKEEDFNTQISFINK